ncbi:hypothetical protein [Gymnodinialimonas hymeniacidonis]|uniref:hypothetical protein n=1 Tax=Gymnodinialimonas hymeniacidonis TaxID=3126508 RepID=UPI0034C6B766
MRLALALLAALAGPVAAQEFRGVTLGEPIPESAPEPVGSEVAHPFAYTLWQFDDGLSMSATRDAEIGEVLYLEMWRSEGQGQQPTPIDGLTFGETTRGDLHARFGSEGIVFEGRGRFAEAGPVAVYFISYEIEGLESVVSFVTIQPLATASEEVADQSVLDAVIVADGRYLDQIWGVNRGRLPGYAPIEDPFAD